MPAAPPHARAVHVPLALSELIALALPEESRERLVGRGLSKESRVLRKVIGKCEGGGWGVE